VGLVLLLASAVGATVVLNASQAGDSSRGKGGSAGADDEMIVALGFADVENGVAHLNPLMAGKVTEVAREDESYPAGAVLLRLDDEGARLRVREAKEELALAQERLQQAQTKPREELEDKIGLQVLAVKAAEKKRDATAAALADKQYDVRKGLLAKLRVKPLEALRDQAQTLVEVEQKKLQLLRNEKDKMDQRAKEGNSDVTDEAKLARRVVEAKMAAVKRAETALNDFVVRAPVAGKALRVLVRKGEIVGPQRAPAVIQFCPAGPRIIRAEVEQEYAGLVTQGAAVTVVDDSSSGPHWSGRVERLSDWYTRRRTILQEPKIFNDVRTLECIVSLELAKGQKTPRIGQRVRVRIRTPRRAP
jgi:multidrug resistance efflux pump